MIRIDAHIDIEGLSPDSRLQAYSMAKRRRNATDGEAAAEPIILNEPCSICGIRESAVKARRSSKPLCVLHYFTTTAPHRRNNAAPHTILSHSIVTEQTPEVQDVFSTAFVELQQEIHKHQDLAMATKQQNQHQAPHQAVVAVDPLAILSRWHGGKKKKTPAPTACPIQKKKNRKQPPSTSNEGGFLRTVPLPAEIVQTQQTQMSKQHALTQRITGSPQRQYKKKKHPGLCGM